MATIPFPTEGGLFRTRGDAGMIGLAIQTPQGVSVLDLPAAILGWTPGSIDLPSQFKDQLLSKLGLTEDQLADLPLIPIADFIQQSNYGPTITDLSKIKSLAQKKPAERLQKTVQEPTPGTLAGSVGVAPGGFQRPQPAPQPRIAAEVIEPPPPRFAPTEIEAIQSGIDKLLTGTGFADQPAAQQQRATLRRINPETGKLERKAVDVGSQEAQALFGQGFVLEKAGEAPDVPATLVAPDDTRKIVKTAKEAQELFRDDFVLEEKAPPVPATLIDPKTGAREPVHTPDAKFTPEELFEKGFELETKPGVGVKTGDITPPEPTPAPPAPPEIPRVPPAMKPVDEDLPPPKDKAPKPDAKTITDRINEESEKLHKIIEKEDIPERDSAKRIEEITKKLLEDAEAPEAPKLADLFAEEKKRLGIDALQTKLDDIDSQIERIRAEAFVVSEEKGEQPLSMRVIGRQRTAIEKQAQREIALLQIERSSIAREAQTKLDALQMTMTLTQQDFSNSSQVYNQEFTRNLQRLDVMTTEEDRERADQKFALDVEQLAFSRGLQLDDRNRAMIEQELRIAEKTKQNAQANLQTMLNLVNASGKTFADMTDDQLQQLKQWELEAGFPAGTFETFGQAVPNATILKTTTGTDAAGNDIVTFIYEDPETGKPGTIEIVKTGGVRQPTGSTAEGRRGREEAEDEDDRAQIAQEISEIRGTDKFVDTAKYKELREKVANESPRLVSWFEKTYAPEWVLNPDDPTAKNLLLTTTEGRAIVKGGEEEDFSTKLITWLNKEKSGGKKFIEKQLKDKYGTIPENVKEWLKQNF